MPRLSRQLIAALIAALAASGSTASAQKQVAADTPVVSKLAEKEYTYAQADDFAAVVAAVERHVAKHGAADTLLVIDIDNTLLAMEGPLGSDQWYEWQRYLQANEPDSHHLVASDMPGLLEVQGLLFMLGKMRPPQDDLPDLVRGVQEQGVPTLILTSRGPDFRVATERELKARGYEFASTVIETEGVPTETHLPYEPGALVDCGVTLEEAGLFGIDPDKAPREVSFAEGVYMTSGQHKGAMLLTILHRAKRSPKAVVFVDDHGRHVNRVFDTLVRRGIECTAIHYGREDVNVDRFRYSDKSGVTQQWLRLKAALEGIGTLSSGDESEDSTRSTQPAAAP